MWEHNWTWIPVIFVFFTFAMGIFLQFSFFECLRKQCFIWAHLFNYSYICQSCRRVLTPPRRPDSITTGCRQHPTYFFSCNCWGLSLKRWSRTVVTVQSYTSELRCSHEPEPTHTKEKNPRLHFPCDERLLSRTWATWNANRFMVELQNTMIHLFSVWPRSGTLSQNERQSSQLQIDAWNEAKQTEE